MGAFDFDKCCFCIELKTGCFIIGYLSLIGYFSLTVLCILAIIGGVVLTNHPELVEEQDYIDAGIPKDYSGAEVGIAITVVFALFLVFVVFMLTFIIVLLVGLHKNKPDHLKVYLIYAWILIFLSILGLIAIAVRGSHRSTLGQTIFNIVWNIYTTLVIRSQYRAMRDSQRRPAIYSAA